MAHIAQPHLYKTLTPPPPAGGGGPPARGGEGQWMAGKQLLSAFVSCELQPPVPHLVLGKHQLGCWQQGFCATCGVTDSITDIVTDSRLQPL
jgi:hypothetical protein